MLSTVAHFVDPTIPGLSGRDLMSRPSDSGVSLSGLRETVYAKHREHRIKRALADLNVHLLRDLGFDRSAA